MNVVTDLSNSFHPYPKSKQTGNKPKSEKQIRQKSNKLAKKEKNRFSILQNKKECFICKTQRDLTQHEAFGGCRRQKSIEWGMVYYLCEKCHVEVENNEKIKKQLKLYAQSIFTMKFGVDLFLKEFNKKY